MIIVGIDEVGRGCWAGPLVSGAVILPPDLLLEDGPINKKIILRDSKKMSKKQRDITAEFVNEHALAVGLGWVWPAEIDEIGLTAAVKQAMLAALRTIDVAYDEVIIDGNINYIPDDSRVRSVIKADDSVPAVSAASIVAKVARDNYMAEAAEHFPVYGFDSHVGYGTAAHIAALKQFGVCELHRQSYKPIKQIMGLL